MKRLFALLLISCLFGTAPGVAQTDASSSQSDDSDYYVGAEDLLDIQIWGHPDLSGPARVDFNGMLQLPRVGEFTAAGRSLAELTDYLTERYQLLDSSIPNVIITVTQYISKSVTVIGEVRKPGRYGFRTIPDIWAVILEAGGTTGTADLSRVQIVRESVSTGETETFSVDLSDGIESTPPEELPLLQAKDSIVIDAIGAGNATGKNIKVLGAVRTPGIYRLSIAENVTEAIAASGGYLPNADLGKVRLTRTIDGHAISYQLDLKGYLYDARPAADLVLQPDDVITIPDKESIFSHIVNNVIKLAPVITTVLSLTLVARR